MILSGKSKKDVAFELNTLGIATPRVHQIEIQNYKCEIKDSTKKWDTKKIDEILKNKTYTGDLVQGVRKKISHKIHKNMRVEDNEWIIVPNHHKSIISKEEYNKVQEILYERYIRVNKENNYDSLIGHLKCNECGKGFTIKSSKGHKYYYCSSYLRKKVCSSHSYKKEELEKNIVDIINNFRNMILDIDIKVNEILKVKELSYDIEVIKSQINSLDERIKKNTLLRNSVVNDLREKLISEDEYWEYSSEYSKNIKKLKEEKSILNNKLNTISFGSQDSKEWINDMKKLKEVNKLNKLLIDELVEDIVIDKKQNVKIVFKCEDKFFEALDFINRNKCDII